MGMERPGEYRWPRPSEVSWWDVRRQPLMFALAALCSGAVLARAWPGTALVWLAAAAASLLVWKTAARRRCAWLSLLALWSFLFAGGGFWTHARWRIFRADELGLQAHREAQPVCLLAVARSAPRRLAAQDAWSPQLTPTWRMRVRVTRVRDGLDWRAASGQAPLLIQGETVPQFLPGDLLLIHATLQAPSPPLNPGEFSRARAHRANRELFTLEVSSPHGVRRVQTGHSADPRRLLERMRLHAQQLLRQHVGQPHAPVAIALLLGSREQLDRQTTLQFLQSGTIHLLAISGLHLGMLVGVIWFAARLGWLRRRPALLLAAAFVIPYAALTGGQPPVVRAAALAVCISFGRWLGRPLLNGNLLAASALGVFVLNPLSLFQTGTQLSFLAVATLAFAARNLQRPLAARDPLQRLIQASRPAWRRRLRLLLASIWRIWLTGFAVWLVALPLVLYRFHLLSPLALFLNPLLWLPVAGALLSGFVVLLSGDLLPALAWAAGSICSLCLGCIQAGTQWSVEPLAGYRWLPAPAGWWVGGWYAALALLAASPRCRPRPAVRLVLALLWLAIGWGEWQYRQRQLCRERHLTMTFFAVGHGTCVLLEGPGGFAALYDAGRMGPPAPIADCVAHYLWSRGHMRLNAVVISHADADHFNAMPAIHERFPVPRALVPEHVVADTSTLLTSLREQWRAAATELRVTAAPDQPAILPGVAIRVLHPPRSAREASDNANSLVLQIEFAGRRVLLPGDLESPGLEQLLAQPGRTCDVLMAPHHGSQHSDPQAMSAWCRPRWVIVSNHLPAAPSLRDAYERHGAVVLDTATSGAVSIGIEADGRMWIRCWRSGE
jgi:competence protein ComEC